MRDGARWERGSAESSSQTVSTSVWNTAEIRKSGERLHFSIVCFHQCQRRAPLPYFLPNKREKRSPSFLPALLFDWIFTKSGKDVSACSKPGALFEHVLSFSSIPVATKNQQWHTGITISDENVFPPESLGKDYYSISIATIYVILYMILYIHDLLRIFILKSFNNCLIINCLNKVNVSNVRLTANLINIVNICYYLLSDI